MSIFPSLSPVNGSYGPVTLEGWDKAELGGYVLPGKCRVTRGGIKIKLDQKSKAGADGARLTVHGLDPQEFDLEVICFTDDQREALAIVFRQLMPLRGVQRKPVSFDHPSVRHFGTPINVQVLGSSILEVDGPGRTKCTIQLRHWMPPAKGIATATPTRKVQNVRAEAQALQSLPNPQPAQSISYAPPNFTQGT